MADFENQVEGLTGLTIGTSPTTTELSQFLVDGVLDVTNRHLKKEPLDRYLFQRVSDEQTSNGLDINGAKIIGVIRESGTNNDWRDCAEIHPSRQGQAVATGSLYLATVHNPVYTVLENGSVSVFPAPGSDPNAFKVYYVNNVPQDKAGAALIHSHSDIKYFADDKVYLVVLYAGIKALDNALSSKSIAVFKSPAPFTIPASLSDSSVSFSEVGSFPAFVKPTFTAPTLGAIGSLTLPTIPVVPSLTDPSISFSTTVPTYTGQVMAPDFSNANTHITDEDPEMVASRVQVIGAQVSEFSAKIQNELQEFNESNTEYQAQLQISIQNAQLKSKGDSNTLQKYSAELSVYQAEVNAKIQEWVNEEWNQNFQKYQTDYGQLLQEYTSSIQSENNRVQNEAQDYQQKVNKALQTYQAETGYDTSRINVDIQKEVQRFTQDLAKNTSTFQTEVQKETSEYQWMHERRQGLKQEYNQAFAIQQQQQ